VCDQRALEKVQFAEWNDQNSTSHTKILTRMKGRESE
jgi:hypothetical protein